MVGIVPPDEAVPRKVEQNAEGVRQVSAALPRHSRFDNAEAGRYEPGVGASRTLNNAEGDVASHPITPKAFANFSPGVEATLEQPLKAKTTLKALASADPTHFANAYSVATYGVMLIPGLKQPWGNNH
jgi:hypothetical protein